MSLDLEDLATAMISAFRGTLAEKWPEIKEYAASEARKLSENLILIEKLKLTNEINDTQAKLMLDLQKNATRAVLLTIEGLGLLAVEQAVNNALAVIKESVNTALGFELI